MNGPTKPTPWATVETLTVERRALRVAHRPGDGVPLMLFNGLACSLEVMEPFAAALPARTPLMAFDVPGIGLSPPPRRPYRLWELARLAAALTRRLGYERSDALGVSWGGALAQQFAWQHPRCCRRLVLVSTGALPLLRPTPRVLRELWLNERHMPAKAQAVAPSIYGGKMRQEPSLVGLLHRNLPPSPRGRLYQQLALVGWTGLPLLPMIRQPALVMTGDDDPLVPMVNSRILTAGLPHARLHVFHDGHMGMLTSAEDVAATVSEFRAG